MNNPVNPLQKEDKKNDAIANMRGLIASQTKAIKATLPKHIDFGRFCRIALNAMATTPKLLECDQNSFLLAVMRSAQLGLEPDGLMGQAYLIPYGKSVQLQIGYKGYITLARQSGEISFITAEAVHENDDFDLNIFATPRFSPYLKGDRGELLGFIAVARFKDESFQYVFMTKDEVDTIRSKTQAWKQALSDAKYDNQGNITKFVNKWGKEVDSVPWFHHYNEMAKKTAIRRLAKYLPLSVQKAEKIESLQEAGISFDIQNGDIVEMQDITPQEEVIDIQTAPEPVTQPVTPHPAPVATPQPVAPQPQRQPFQADLGETMDDLLPM